MLALTIFVILRCILPEPYFFLWVDNGIFGVLRYRNITPIFRLPSLYPNKFSPCLRAESTNSFLLSLHSSMADPVTYTVPISPSRKKRRRAITHAEKKAIREHLRLRNSVTMLHLHKSRLRFAPLRTRSELKKGYQLQHISILQASA